MNKTTTSRLQKCATPSCKTTIPAAQLFCSKCRANHQTNPEAK